MVTDHSVSDEIIDRRIPSLANSSISKQAYVSHATGVPPLQGKGNKPGGLHADRIRGKYSRSDLGAGGGERVLDAHSPYV